MAQATDCRASKGVDACACRWGHEGLGSSSRWDVPRRHRLVRHRLDRRAVALTATAPAPSASASTTAETAGPPSALFRQEHLLRLIDPSSTSRASSLSLPARTPRAPTARSSRPPRAAGGTPRRGLSMEAGRRCCFTPSPPPPPCSWCSTLAAHACGAALSPRAARAGQRRRQGAAEASAVRAAGGRLRRWPRLLWRGPTPAAARPRRAPVGPSTSGLRCLRSSG